MLVFYPEFSLGPESACEEVVILLDTSESMRGEALRQAQRVALQALQTLDADIRVNVVLFGTGGVPCVDFSPMFSGILEGPSSTAVPTGPVVFLLGLLVHDKQTLAAVRSRNLPGDNNS